MGGVGGPQPSDSCSEPSDMRGGFGSLAQQGFPYAVCRPASRQASRQTVHIFGGKDRAASFFDGLQNPAFLTKGTLDFCLITDHTSEPEPLLVGSGSLIMQGHPPSLKPREAE